MSEMNLGGRSYVSQLLRSIRIHQWSKNLLIFVPLIAAHRFGDVTLVWKAALAFAVFCGCASSAYLLNDLLDLEKDRRHPSKRFRPLAAGEFPIRHAKVLIPSLLVASLATSLAFLPLEYSAALCVYYLVTVVYSMWIKRIVMIDVVTLAMLYAIRVIAGAFATAQTVTFWLLAFCVFIFLSLAFLKRYTELRLGPEQSGPERDYGRGYQLEDFALLAAFGCAAGYISVLVLALYINDVSSAAVYRTQKWLWPACLVLLAWISRAWLIAHRGKMHDDPIVFALRDNPSRWMGVAFFASFILASL